MSTTDPVTSTGSVACGACSHKNSGEEKFCASCGQSLIEPCTNCGKPVALSQKYCGTCGCDLEAELQKRILEQNERLAQAVELAKRHEYDRAITILTRVSELTDFRFANDAAKAKEAVAKVQQLRDQLVASATKNIQQSIEAFESGNHEQTISLLSDVPEPMLDEESKLRLERAKSHVDQVNRATVALREAIADKNWVSASGLLTQLIELQPDEPKYPSLVRDVSAKLLSRGKKLLAASRYQDATDCITSIPSDFRSDKIDQLQQDLEDIRWLSAQFERQLFATPVLGRLCQRWVRQAPGDKTAKKTLSELAAKVKQPPENRRRLFPEWHLPNRSWLEAPIGILAWPQSLNAETDPPRQSYLRFAVAIGLALQGLGRSRLDSNFQAKRGGVAALRKPRKATSCWGVDIGATGVRGVELKLNDESVVITNTFSADFERPTCRVGNDSGSQDVRNALQRLAEQHDIGDTPLWINLPATDVVTRFVRLPPIDARRSAKLLDEEARQRIPLPMDQLRVVRWMSDTSDDSGRPASVSVARHTVVDLRNDLVQSAGLTVRGIQSDSMALLNFVDHEFADTWQEDSTDEGAKKDGDAEPASNHESQPSIAIVDCGAAASSLLISNPREFWFGTVENAGENITAAVARATKSDSAVAEQLKKDPSKIERPSEAWAPVESRYAELRARLKQQLAESKKMSLKLDVHQCWCVGGACLAHGWIGHVLLDE